MYWVILIIVSLVVGSFLNVVIHRIPKMIEAEISGKESKVNLCFPRSHCPSCGKALKWWHNIPVLSYILLQGKCGYCEMMIAKRYFVVEVAAVLGALLAVYVFGFTLPAACLTVFTWFLICLFFIDAKTQYLPDCLTLPLLWLGLLVNTQGIFTSLKSAVYGAVLGYIILWILFYGFKLVTKKDGMGFGDFKLLAALGAWVGWMQVPVILFFSAVLTLVFFLLMIFTGKVSRDTPVAFGPALCIVGLVFFYFGHDIMHMWLGDLVQVYS